MTDCLLGLHVFSECDTVSSFADKGKLSALKLLKKQQYFQDLSRELGESWTVTEALKHGLEDYVCSLYNCSNTDLYSKRSMIQSVC